MIRVEFGGLSWDDPRPVMFHRRSKLHRSLPLPPRPWTDKQMMSFQWETACGRIHQNVRVVYVTRDHMPEWCRRCFPPGYVGAVLD